MVERSAFQDSCLLHPNNSKIKKEGLVFKTHSQPINREENLILWAQFTTHTGTCRDPATSCALLSSPVLVYCSKTPSAHLLSYSGWMQILSDLNMDGFHTWFLIRNKVFLVQVESKRILWSSSVKFLCDFTCRVTAMHRTLYCLVMCDFCICKY